MADTSVADYRYSDDPLLQIRPSSDDYSFYRRRIGGVLLLLGSDTRLVGVRVRGNGTCYCHRREESDGFMMQVAVNHWERKWVFAFIGLNIIDAALTSYLVRMGYLCMEFNYMKRLFTIWGPPHYSFEIFWLVKMLIAFGGVYIFYRLAQIAPRLQKLIFTLPVYIMTGVCIINLIGIM